MRLSFYKKNSGNRGFTIVELMIALTVLSVILVMATTIMIQISNLYSKGVSAANLQNTTRNLTADLASTLQFGGNKPSSCNTLNVRACYTDSAKDPNFTAQYGMQVHSFCVNTTRYSFVLDRKMGHDESSGADVYTPHVLWRDTMSSNASCPPLDLSKDVVTVDRQSAEWAGDATKPSKGFEMVANNTRINRFRVEPKGGGVYQLNVSMSLGDNDLLALADSDGHRNCKGGAGTEFCASTKVETTVKRRLLD